MPWLVGIDEAGYGPNLGPFVMTSVACHVPEELAGGNLWRALRAVVRRDPAADDSRILIEDSKVVYTVARGLADLETAVLATVAPWPAGEAVSLHDYAEWACPACVDSLRGEPWYTGESRLPVMVEAEVHERAAGRFRRASERRQIVWGRVRSVVVCPRQFNELLDGWGSKGAALGEALAELVRFNRSPEGTDPVYFCVDKHGGRNHYGALLQQAVPEGFVMAQAEGMEDSSYTVLGLERPVRLSFRPRADSSHFCVALASMCSKYLREILMREFNEFWRTHLPGIKPTAGYPGDAARFFDEIRPAVKRLGIPEHVLWRRK